MSSARSHMALPFLAPDFDKAFSWSLASLAILRALSESLSAAAIPMRAAATTSATKGFWLIAFKLFTAFFGVLDRLGEVAVFRLSFLSLGFFFLSFATAITSRVTPSRRSYHFPSHVCNK